MATEQSIKFLVLKLFVEGSLQGIVVADISPVPFNVGQTYGGQIYSGGKYKIVSCEKVAA